MKDGVAYGDLPTEGDTVIVHENLPFGITLSRHQPLPQWYYHWVRGDPFPVQCNVLSTVRSILESDVK